MKINYSGIHPEHFLYCRKIIVDNRQINPGQSPSLRHSVCNSRKKARDLKCMRMSNGLEMKALKTSHTLNPVSAQ